MPNSFRRTLEYLNKALAVKAHDGNLAALTLTLVKELTTAVSNTPKVAMLATLTQLPRGDYASLAGEDMQDRLSKVVGRAENIDIPVEGDDIFPILHRRLFTSIGSEQERQEVADSFAEYYAGCATRCQARTETKATETEWLIRTRSTLSSSTFSPTGGGPSRDSSGLGERYEPWPIPSRRCPKRNRSRQ